MLVPIADRVGRILYQKRDPHFLQKHDNAAYPVLSLIEDAAVHVKTVMVRLERY